MVPTNRTQNRLHVWMHEPEHTLTNPELKKQRRAKQARINQTRESRHAKLHLSGALLRNQELPKQLNAVKVSILPRWARAHASNLSQVFMSTPLVHHRKRSVWLARTNHQRHQMIASWHRLAITSLKTRQPLKSRAALVRSSLQKEKPFASRQHQECL